METRLIVAYLLIAVMIGALVLGVLMLTKKRKSIDRRDSGRGDHM